LGSFGGRSFLKVCEKRASLLVAQNTQQKKGGGGGRKKGYIKEKVGKKETPARQE